MKIDRVRSLIVPEIKVIRFARFCDQRGFFSEHYRKSDFVNHAEMGFMKGVDFVQANESFSRAGTVRGLHFQWNPFMGKMVRTLSGHMIDLALDIRKGSPTFGKVIAYDMPASYERDFSEWIWLPPGFAHGNFFIQDSTIEYFCSGEYSPGCEAGISPLAQDVDWSLCTPVLKALFHKVVSQGLIITDKDRHALSLDNWIKDDRSENFIYGRC